MNCFECLHCEVCDYWEKEAYPNDYKNNNREACKYFTSIENDKSIVMLDTYRQIENLINELKIVRVDLSGDGEPISQVEEPVVNPDVAGILADLLVNNGVIVQKKGYWIFRDGSIYATCSVCNKSQAYVYDQDIYQKYCGCCGAKMSLEEPI